MSIKIQINSLEALERLIGGDTEMEIDIRNSVVQEFSKRHLKYLVDKEMVQNNIESEIREARKTINNKIREAVTEQIGEFRWGRFELSKPVKEAVERKTEEMVSAAITETAQRIIDMNFNEEWVKEIINTNFREKVLRVFHDGVMGVLNDSFRSGE